MRKEFIVERQGRAFCLFAGLLDLAHQQGLKSIVTSIAQIPGSGNDNTAICQATVVMLGADGVERVFSGIGDANPRNVAPAMLTCLLRMAETRAKARALRDAVNVGVAAFEELDDTESAPPRQELRSAAGAQTASRNAAPPASPSGKCPSCGTTGRFHGPGCSRASVAA